MLVELIMVKSKFNLKAEASKNKLSYLWWVIDPVLHMAVFYVVFGLLLERGGEDYVAYLLIGLVAFQWFAKSVQGAAPSILRGKGLMNQINVEPIFFPLVAIMVNTAKQMPVFIMLFLFLVIYGLLPTIHWLAIPLLFAVNLLFIIAIGLIPAMMIPYLKDLNQIVPTGIQFLLFSSGTFISLEQIPVEYREYFLMNPVANVLYQYRLILLHHQWPDFVLLSKLFIVSISLLAIVLLAYAKVKKSYPRVVSE